MSREPNDKEGWRAWHTIVRLPEFPLRRGGPSIIVIDNT